MIIYNINKNGPYQYDKFILNIFQIITAVRTLENNIKTMNLKKDNNVLTLENRYNMLDNYMNKIYLLMLQYEE